MFQATLRRELVTRLGVVFDDVDRHGVAEVVGVSADMRRAFSRRRVEIVAEMNRLGVHSGEGARIATLTTRKAKLTGIKSATAEDRKRAKREKARRDAAQRENQRNDAAKQPPPQLPPPVIPPVVEPLPPDALPEPNAAAAADAAAQAGEQPPADDAAAVVGGVLPEAAPPAEALPAELPPAPPAEEPPPPVIDEPAVVFPVDGFEGQVEPVAPPNE